MILAGWFAVRGISTGVELPVWEMAAAGIVLVWTLVLIAQLTIKYGPQGGRNYLPQQIFIVAVGSSVFSGGAEEGGGVLSSLLCAWLLVLALRQFIFSMHKGFRFEQVFRAGLYLGFVPLLYAPCAPVVLIFVPAALGIFRRSWREWIVGLAGLVVPVGMVLFAGWATRSVDMVVEWSGAPARLWTGLTTLPAGGLTGWIDGFWLVRVPVPTLVVWGLVVVAGAIGALWPLSRRAVVRKTPLRFMAAVALVLCLLLLSAAIPSSSGVLVPMVGAVVALSLPYAFQGRWATVSTVIYCATLIAVVV